MTTFQGTVSVNANLVYQGAADIGELEQRVNYSKSIQLTDGNGANQAQKLFTDTRTISASSSENLDLAGSLLDAFGGTLTLGEVKAIIISASANNTNDVVVGGAASNTWLGPFSDATDKVNVKPGGTVAFFAPNASGYGVTTSSGDILKVANSGAGSSVTYDILIIGNP